MDESIPKILKVTGGPIQENCYFVYPEQGGTLYIIDPGWDAEKLSGIAMEYKAEETVVLLTHAHVDHIYALGELTKRLDIKKIFLSPEDGPLYESPENHIEPYMQKADSLPVTSGRAPDCGDFTVILSPGHSRGGVCYYFKSLGVLFSGDSIFKGSIGRTDLPGGDYKTLMRSVRSILKQLPPDTVVYPGHGSETSIGLESSTNPFL